MAYCLYSFLFLGRRFFPIMSWKAFFLIYLFLFSYASNVYQKRRGGRPGKIACAIHGHDWQRHGIVDGTKCPLAATPHSFSVGADLFP